MTIRDAVRRGAEKLKAAGIESAIRESGIILCFVIKSDKAFLYSHDDEELSETDEKKFFALVAKRAEGTPLQYITGHQEFMSLDFFVNNHVLIPRHDTEILVETVISWCRERRDLCLCRERYELGLCRERRDPNNCAGSRKIRILDMGTGSGCIAVSLAYYLDDVEIIAVDISEKAIETALYNAKINGVDSRIKFVKSDLFASIKDYEKFDVIVSNPPYIPTCQINELKDEVRHHEPIEALDGGKDGLVFYKRITKDALSYLKPGGLLAFETGFDQARGVADIMRREGYTDIRIFRDLAGIERVVTGMAP